MNYAVTGDPVTQSLSPYIHSRFAQQTGEDVRYGLLPLKAEEFDAGCRQFFERGGRGLNVTAPHKAAALALCDRASGAARRARAVNTITHAPNGQLYGENTDGPGLVNDLTRYLNIPLRNRRLLLVGAGGAGRGVMDALLAARPAELVVTNRTFARAESTVAQFARRGPVRALPMDQCDGGWDVVVNATSASLSGGVPPLADSVAHDAVCYDMSYAAGGTVFTAWADARGARSVHTGIGMLIEQAALAFMLWRGRSVDTAPLRGELARDRGIAY